MIPGIRLVLPIRAVSRNRVRGLSRGAMIAHAKRQAAEKQAAFLAVSGHLRARGLTGEQLAPVVVRLTRVSAGRMDDDNAVASLKWIQDGIAKALGIDDGDTTRLRFLYGQRKGERREYGVEVRIEQSAPKGAPMAARTIQPPLPSFAVPRFPAAGKGCECPGVPRAVALPFDDRDFGDPERRAWWGANWKRIAWRARQCPDCGAGWYVRELLEQEPRECRRLDDAKGAG